MAEFTPEEWQKINDVLDKDPGRFGFPERREDSVILSSFNIRKLGKVDFKKRPRPYWDFLARYCRQCDLLGIQEVMQDMSGLRFLHGLIGGNNRYGLVVSDATGTKPGEAGLNERLAFVYNWSTVSRAKVASDVAYERSQIIRLLSENAVDYIKALEALLAQHRAFDAETDPQKKKKLKPELDLPGFLAFIRSPYLVGFQIDGFDGADPYRILAINAHLLYGTPRYRKLEFQALMDWIVNRVKEKATNFYEDFFLFGDLNLDFTQQPKLEGEVTEIITGFNKGELKSKRLAKVNFPFLSVHPGQKKLFDTAARSHKTFDQIGIFAFDERLPPPSANDSAGSVPGGFDYGVFDFVAVFLEALFKPGKTKDELTSAERKTFFAKFEHDLSDHMPIWVRLPKPYMGQPLYENRK